MLKRAIVGFVVLAVAVASAAADQLEDAAAAYVNGDFAKALSLFQPLAEQGDAAAQNSLGDMYVNGEGVTRDDAEAARWYSRAAAQGTGPAQNVLGVLYFTGQGVRQDYVQSYLWFDLAAAHGEFGAGEGRDLAAARLAPDQLVEARRLVREWQPKPER